MLVQETGRLLVYLVTTVNQHVVHALCELALPLFFWLFATRTHTLGEEGSPCVCSSTLRCNSAAGVKRRQENGAGWMDLLIRLTPRDIWQENKESQNNRLLYLPLSFFFFPFGNNPNQSSKVSPSKGFLKKMWGVSSAFLFVSWIGCWHLEFVSLLLLVTGSWKHEPEKGWQLAHDCVFVCGEPASGDPWNSQHVLIEWTTRTD